MPKPRAILRTFPDASVSALILASSYTLSDSVGAQKLFNVPANGSLFLETGTYLFDTLTVVTSMSGTSGNAAFSFAGTATVGTVLGQTIGIDVTAVTGTGARSGLFFTSLPTAASALSAGGGTAMGLQIPGGTFRVTTRGTIIPSITLVTGGVTPSVAAGSYFICRWIGPSTMTTVGAWT